ncbi:hypothetical protein [Nocardia sp. NPDC057668]|uniref:hypothetical protein n=1 Tax=Nocardia sp. NPDC057668 TaxID=3346202 RepID=UPI00366EBFB5
MDGGNAGAAPVQAWKADRVAVYAWSILMVITVVSVMTSSYTRGWNYEPAVVVLFAGIKFWIIAFQFMTNRGSVAWLRAALGVYAVLLVAGLSVPYFV